MNKPSIVKAASACGYNLTLLQLVGVGPKWTISCGECRLSFKQRLPMTDNPAVKCPHCGSINTLDGLHWSNL